MKKGITLVVLTFTLLYVKDAYAETKPIPYEADAINYGRLLSVDDATHLTIRTGFGASSKEIDSLLELPRKQAVHNTVLNLSGSPTTILPTWVSAHSANYWRRQELPQSEKQRFSTYRDNEIQSLKNWWISEMISTPSPQTERLVLFWHNHFSTAYSAINKNSTAIAKQHQTIRKHASGNFRTLLKEIVRDPAMLNYLDNNVSKKNKPNENLARELLELFSLGEGNYTESDVKNAARALTGYTYSNVQNMRFVFNTNQHDKSQKTIFGVTGNFDGDDLVDLILAQPEAARFIAAKMWREYISDIDTDDDRLTIHADRFRKSNYDIKTLYASLLNSEDFWHPDNRKALIQSPLSLTVGAIRSTGELPVDWQSLPQQIALMGQDIFEPPNVAGWPGGEAWITPGRLLTRMDWLERMAHTATTPATTPNMMNNMSMSQALEADSSAMAMNAKSSMSASSMFTNEKSLTLQLASEEYDGPANYTALITTKNSATWDSGEQTLTGGHQTERMGRVTEQGKPWQYVNFPIPFNAEEIDNIKISFTNDAAKSGIGDRNLFVKRAIVGDKTWLALDGKQDSTCLPKSATRQGNLYCNGTLTLAKPAVNLYESPQQSNANELTATGVYLSYVHNPNKKSWAAVAFRLSDARFGERSWSTLGFSYVKDKGEYAISLSATECWPECFTQIPEQCMVGDNPHINAATIYLNPKRGRKCIFESLSISDQRLFQALFSLIPAIYDEGAGTYKLRKASNQKSYDAWEHHIQAIHEITSQTSFYNADLKLNIIEHTQIDHTATQVLQPPLPAGITSSDRIEALDRLRTRIPESELPTLLMAKDKASITAALKDLSYQLR